jgi:hypothetical protein
MELSLVNQELCESRLYRSSHAMRQLTGRAVADLTYLNTLVVYLLLQDDVQHDYAASYAAQTAQYGGYHSFKTSATDLYLLCYTVSNPVNNHIRLDQHSDSVDFLKRLSFDSGRHLRFMRSLAVSADRTNEANSYFFRLESQLNIKENRYKAYRRLVTDWGDLSYSKKQLSISKITQEIRRLGRGSELLSPLTTMLKYKNFRVEPEYSEPRVSLTKKLAGAAAGAIAARYAADKITSTKPETFKKVATGLGAIAGYWAAGRSKKQ